MDNRQVIRDYISYRQKISRQQSEQVAFVVGLYIGFILTVLVFIATK